MAGARDQEARREDLQVVLAIAIRRRRLQLRLRQADVARRCGWRESRLTRIEAGEQRVLLQDLPLLCDALQISLADLLREADERDLRALAIPR